MNRIKELRQERGLTQTELARRSGVDQRTIATLESGRSKAPSLPIALQLAEALNIAPAELLTKQPDAAPTPVAAA